MFKTIINPKNGDLVPDCDINGKKQYDKNGKIIFKKYDRKFDLPRTDTKILVRRLKNDKYKFQHEEITKVLNERTKKKLKRKNKTTLTRNVIKLKTKKKDKPSIKRLKNREKSINIFDTEEYIDKDGIVNLNHRTIPFINERIEITKQSIEEIVGNDFSMTRISKVPNQKEYLNDSGYIFPPQILTALEIILKMLQGFRYIVISAKTQSGKTGAANSIDFILSFYPEIREKLNLVLGEGFFITPMSDNSNKEQLKKDHTDQSGAPGNSKIVPDKNVLHNDDLKTKKELLTKLNNLHRTIIFIDESHLAPDKDSLSNLFLNAAGILSNGSSTEEMKRRDIFYISISATPFDEIAADTEKNKEVITLYNTDGYKGVEYFYNKKLLSQSYVLQGNESRFKNDALEIQSKYFKKYNKNAFHFVRIPKLSSELNQKLMMSLIPDGWYYRTFFQDDKYNMNELIENEPNKPTIIFVKDRMYQCYQLSNKNTAMLFDRSVSSYDEKRTTMMIQSFLGRATGYNKPDVVIFTDLKNIETYLKYNNDSNAEIKSKSVKTKEIYDADVRLMSVDFNERLDLFAQFKSLKRKDKDKLFEIINTIEDVSFLKNQELINVYHYNDKNSSYKYIITGGYDAIKNNDGYSSNNYVFIKDNKIDSDSENKYKVGDKLYSILIDENNNKVIIAQKTLVKADEKKLVKTIVTVDKDCKYHQEIKLVDGEEYKFRGVQTINCLGWYKNVTVYLDREKNLILRKGSIVEPNDFELEDFKVENHKVQHDLIKPVVDLDDALNIIKDFKILCFSEKENATFKTENGSDFIELLKMQL